MGEKEPDHHCRTIRLGGEGSEKRHAAGEREKEKKKNNRKKKNGRDRFIAGTKRKKTSQKIFIIGGRKGKKGETSLYSTLLC